MSPLDRTYYRNQCCNLNTYEMGQKIAEIFEKRMKVSALTSCKTVNVPRRHRWPIKVEEAIDTVIVEKARVSHQYLSSAAQGAATNNTSSNNWIESNRIDMCYNCNVHCMRTRSRCWYRCHVSVKMCTFLFSKYKRFSFLFHTQLRAALYCVCVW